MVVGTDTISDMLTRIRNANQMRYKTVDIPATKMTMKIADILTEEGYTDGYEVKDGMMVLNLKYNKKESQSKNNYRK